MNIQKINQVKEESGVTPVIKPIHYNNKKYFVFYYDGAIYAEISEYQEKYDIYIPLELKKYWCSWWRDKELLEDKLINWIQKKIEEDK